MGSAPTGFDVLAQAAPAAARQQQQIKEEQRVQQQNTVGAQLLDAINNASNIKPQTKDENGNLIDNPAYAQAQKDKQDLITQYMGLNTPQQHANFADRIHGLIFGNPTPQHQQPALSPNSSPVAPPAPPSGAPAGAAAPTSAAPVHPFSTTPNPVLSKMQEGISALGNHLKAFANPLPPPTPIDSAAIARNYRDPGEVAAERNQALWGVRGENAIKVAEIRKDALLASLQARPPRLLSQTTIPDLLEQMKVDPTMAIYGPEGKELSPAQLAEMPPGTIAREFRAGSQIFYALGDQNSKTMKVGNEVYNIPAVGPITSENSTALGVANPGGTSTHQVPGMNPGEVVTLTGTRAPATTGMAPTAPTGAPQTNPATPTTPVLQRRPDGLANPVPATTQPVNPGARPPGTAPVGGAVKPKSQSAVTPPPAFAPGTMLSQGRSAQPVVSAMSVMAANVFGGNGEAPLWENAKMYDKPDVRQALNKALTLNALATPGTEDNPSFLQTLATGIGATGWSQEQINNANVEARQELERVGGPEALKMFAREAALQEDLSALRTATKASAAQGSIRTLVRAAPVYNVSSAQDFRNQLGATLNTAAASLRGYPAINPEYVKWWDRGVSAAKGGPTSTNAPKVSDATQRPANVPAGYVLRDGPQGKGWYAPKAK